MGTQWRAYSGGPDWTDIHSMSKELESLHGCTCYVLLQFDGSGVGGTISFIASLSRSQPGTDLQAQEIARMAKWPNAVGQNVQAIVFNLLHELDRAALVGWWEQKQLAVGEPPTG